MIESTWVESRCATVAHVLDARAHDEIAMLRSARTLKRIHAHLTREMSDYVRTVGKVSSAIRVQHTLDAVEQDLRCVLIGYPALPRFELHEHLTHALDRTLDAMELLEA